MKLHPDSHLDHNISTSIINYLCQLFSSRNSFFIETVELPEHLGTVPCALYGPVMGDEPIMDNETINTTRGDRPWPSRMVKRPPRQVRTVTVVAGQHEDQDCILYTAYAGPVAPQEPGDPGCRDQPASDAFWAEHALSL